MSMRRGIEGLTRLGDGDLAGQLAAIRGEFKRRHPGMDDISLSGELPQAIGVRNREATLPPLSAETQKLIEQMRNDGYAVYETTCRTPASLVSDGMRYWFLKHELADVTAPRALLAFKKAPSELFLPGSQNIVHDEQVKLIPREQATIDKKYPGAGLVVREGELPEWTELSWMHFQATDRKVRLFGKDYGYGYTWTDTYENEKQGADRAGFGRWDEAFGADASLWNPDRVNPHLGLASLVEIPRK